MSRFLLTFFSVYGAMHAYLFWKIMHAFRGRRAIILAVGILCILLAAAPILTRRLEGKVPLWASRMLTCIGYTWFALIFWFCCLGILTETWNVAIRLVRHFDPSTGRFLIEPTRMLAASGIILFAASTWGLVEASNVHLKVVHLKIDRMPGDTKPLRVVQLTDLHLSHMVGKHHLNKVIALIKQAEPDMIVATGDISDLSSEEFRPLTELLAELRPPLGKFAVFGNHEFYRGGRNGTTFHEAAGFRLLRGKSVTVNGRVRVAGVDFGDTPGQSDASHNTDEDAILPKTLAHDDPVTLLLKHKPTVNPDSLGRFDLQMSGHSHGGQIFPFQIAIRMTYPLGPGLHKLVRGSNLYVSRGAGTWGPPMRLFAPPEVTLFVID